ncbi:hypothetical protein JD844_020842 [Phrynosoma platyrhinos]|uniref:Uncharacterized protein n=1 Tax=Phrynosoma platyrhinos TaxID=52577 RepID=A0ABQ7ST26_PHRPL|nr:hypothetical protein JD844_020842 [Phrynosoma platyrhinos]
MIVSSSETKIFSQTPFSRPISVKLMTLAGVWKTTFKKKNITFTPVMDEFIMSLHSQSRNYRLNQGSYNPNLKDLSRDSDEQVTSRLLIHRVTISR